MHARNTEAEVDDAIAYNFKQIPPSELDGKKVQAPNGEMMTLRERQAPDKRNQHKLATHVGPEDSLARQPPRGPPDRGIQEEPLDATVEGPSWGPREPFLELSWGCLKPSQAVFGARGNPQEGPKA